MKNDNTKSADLNEGFGGLAAKLAEQEKEKYDKLNLATKELKSTAILTCCSSFCNTAETKIKLNQQKEKLFDAFMNLFQNKNTNCEGRNGRSGG